MKQIYSMKDIAPTISNILNIPLPSSAQGKAISEITTSLAGVQKVALLVPDALGLFAYNLWKNEMPWFSSLYEDYGVIIKSVMKSITPINFATMLTGTDLKGHGIAVRTNDLLCESLFDVVRKQGGKSAGIGLNGYTGTELLARYADIPGNAGDGTDDTIAEIIVKIATEHSPTFLIAQFGRVDDSFHKYGPSAPEIGPMLKATDSRLQQTAATLSTHGYGVIIHADHGQHDVIPAPPLGEGKRGTHGTEADEDRLVPCIWIR
jgi:hypothetical protein